MKNIHEHQIILDGYFIDIDHKGQFRIFGPNNHLYLGLPAETAKHIEIVDQKIVKTGKIELTLHIQTNKFNLPVPLQVDVRTFRSSVGLEEGRIKSFDELLTNKKLRSPLVSIKKTASSTSIAFKRQYGSYFYKATFIFPKSSSIKKETNMFIVTSKSDTNVRLLVETNDTKRFVSLPKLSVKLSHMTNRKLASLTASENEAAQAMVQRSFIELQHMLEWGKTSGDRFGTVFPRDWMESADLGRLFLPQKIYETMYERAMAEVNGKGEGWHEEVIGELGYEFRKQHLETINRDMIDIEPHYLLGLPFVSKQFITRNKKKLKNIAKLVMKSASKNPYVTFKKITKAMLAKRPAMDSEYLKGRTYMPRGNWRDIPSSYGAISEIVAPFDVNGVFIPNALKYIAQFTILKDKKETAALYKVWKNKRKDFEFSNPDGLIAFALAKYGKDFTKLTVNHLDESYLYYYDEATEQEVASFAKRVLDKNYLYTPSGPVITEPKNSMKLTTKDYHGTVIWPKTTGYTVLGLYKHLELGKKKQWNKATIKLIEKAVTQTIYNSIRAYIQRGGVPELYYDKNGKPMNFNEQLQTSEESSQVQLWSAMSYIAMIDIAERMGI